MEKIFEIACEHLGIDTNSVNVELVFMNVVEMCELNKRTRGIDEPTDVLAFPLLDIVAGVVPTKDEFPLDINPETNKIELGSVVICREYAELPIDYLCVHGFLHLVGYDHDTQDNERRMFELTDKILERYKGVGHE